jgi:hypothetical protein
MAEAGHQGQPRDGGDPVTGQRPAWYGYETQATRLLDLDGLDGDVAARQLAATRAIGYALLALREHLADQFSDLSHAVVAVAGQVGDLAVPVDRLAGNAGVVRAVAKGPGKSAAMRGYLRRFLRRHPGAVARVYDLKDPGEAAAWTRDQIGLSGLPVQASDGAVTLAAGELATVRQALQDAAGWRSMRSEGAGCGDCDDGGRCADHARDERLADEDRALLACLSGGDVS